MTKQHIETAVKKGVTAMTEYIEREALLLKISRMIDYCKKDNRVNGLTALFQAADAIMDCKSEDVAPVRHGRWIKENSRKKSYLWICSNCRKIAYFCSGDGKCAYQYCPNCGADMSKEDEDE